ncbi:MAG: PspA/IM30 family protein [Flammeovirgaceae bacterium]
MKKLLTILFSLLSFHVAAQQHLSDFKRKKLTIPMGDSVFISTKQLEIDSLWINDDAKIILTQKLTTLIIHHAFIGSNCVIDGQGQDGDPNQDGTNGKHLNLYLGVENVGGLTINLKGGDGGLGGYGGDGGNLTFSYGATTNLTYQNSINVITHGGKNNLIVLQKDDDAIAAEKQLEVYKERMLKLQKELSRLNAKISKLDEKAGLKAQHLADKREKLVEEMKALSNMQVFQVEEKSLALKTSSEGATGLQMNVPHGFYPPPSGGISYPFQATFPNWNMDRLASKLTTSLNDAGFITWICKEVPDGFFILSAIEHINEDGTPHSYQRFADDAVYWDPSNWGSWAELLTGFEDHTRCIAFFYSKGYNKKGKERSLDHFKNLIKTEPTAIPDALKTYECTPNHRLEVFVYTFVAKAKTPKKKSLKKMNFTVQEHLRKARIWDKLKLN